MSENDTDPCRCHDSFAAVTPFHPGHCCFWPPDRTCHAEEVAGWQQRRDEVKTP